MENTEPTQYTAVFYINEAICVNYLWKALTTFKFSVIADICLIDPFSLPSPSLCSTVPPLQSNDTPTRVRVHTGNKQPSFPFDVKAYLMTPYPERLRYSVA